MAEDVPDNSMWNVLRYLWHVGDGIPPHRDGHAITPESTSAGRCHGEKQNSDGKNRNQ